MASGNFHAADAYSSFTYWREPLPDIEIDIEAVSDGTSSTTAQSDNKSWPKDRDRKDQRQMVPSSHRMSPKPSMTIMLLSSFM